MVTKPKKIDMAWDVLKFMILFFATLTVFWRVDGDMAWSLEQSRFQNVKDSQKIENCLRFAIPADPFWKLDDGS